MSSRVIAKTSPISTALVSASQRGSTALAVPVLASPACTVRPEAGGASLAPTAAKPRSVVAQESAAAMMSRASSEGPYSLEVMPSFLTDLLQEKMAAKVLLFGSVLPLGLLALGGGGIAVAIFAGAILATAVVVEGVVALVCALNRNWVRRSNEILRQANQIWVEAFRRFEIPKQSKPRDRPYNWEAANENVVDQFREMKIGDGRGVEFLKLMESLDPHSREYYLGMWELARILSEPNPKNSEDCSFREDPYFQVFLQLTLREVENRSRLALPMLTSLGMGHFVPYVLSFPTSKFAAVHQIIQAAEKDGMLARHSAVKGLHEIYDIDKIPKILQARRALSEPNHSLPHLRSPGQRDA